MCVTSRYCIKGHEVDGESFLLFKEEDIKEMLPLVGPRTKLLKKRSELRVNYNLKHILIKVANDTFAHVLMSYFSLSGFCLHRGQTPPKESFISLKCCWSL